MGVTSKKFNVDKSYDNQYEEGDDLDPTITAVFDGDELIYGIGFACEERLHQATNPLNKEGIAHFKNKTTMDKFLQGIELPEGFEFEVATVQKAEPVANALATMKRSINKVRNTLKAANYEVYIGGENNFRDKLPLPKKYKDRDGTIKPLLFPELKEYLLKYHDAQLVVGREADDAITSRMYDGFKSKTKVVGVTQDKDARMASGWLINAKKPNIPEEYIEGLGEVHLDVNAKGKEGKLKGTSRKFFYAQCLLGDSTDTYDPRDLVKHLTGKSPRYGDKSCFKLLNPCNTDKECLQLIADTYKGWFGEEEFKYKDWHGNMNTMDWKGALQMYADCAWMQRWEGDQLDIIKVMTKLGVEL